MLVALYCLEIVGAAVLAGVSALAMEFYSRLIQRSPNRWLQLLIYLVIGVPLIVVVPAGVCVYMIGVGPLPPDKTVRALWVLFVFLCWAALVWTYIARHLDTLRHRLHGPSRI
jgi:hypothetical protein